jgi:hypothetical protein
MDADDLSEDAYAIILGARRVSRRLAAELAMSGKNAKSEVEFLESMLTALRDASENMEEYLDDEVSELDVAQVITRCGSSVRLLLGLNVSIDIAER